MASDGHKERLLAIRRLEDLIFGEMPAEGRLFSDFVPPGVVPEIKKYLGSSTGREVVYYRPNAGSDYGIVGVFESAEAAVGAWPLRVMAIAGLSGDVSHRDVLGSLMALGVERKKIGDIFVRGDTAYVVVMAPLFPYFKDQLKKVGPSPVTVEEVSLTQIEDLGPRYVAEVAVLKSLRIDLVIARAFKVSRNQGKDFFREGRVKLNHLPVKNHHKMLQPGDLVSLRGYGRVRIDAVLGQTQKGNLKVSLHYMN
ncbi:MAG: hypothetical protein AVO33_02750 [delta proteobacterium ML8_F1]|nr:MAG: hypothetical protein AVO33_02750 [delta proteobacterium ML8_F1]